jgi:RND family efflux transporter MFP subunit
MLRLFILLIMSTTLLTGCSAEADSKADPRLKAPLVQFVAIKPDTRQQRTFSGTVEAREQSNLAFRVSGKITARLVDSGQHVNKGQVLMRLDKENLELQVIASQRAIDAAQAELFKVSADELRMRDLVDNGTISAQQYDHAVAALRSAKANLSMIKANASVVENSNKYSELVADADGIIVSTQGEPGQVVSAGQQVIQLAKDDLREAVISLPETIRPALNSLATANYFNSAIIATPTHLRELSNSADPITRTYEARYVLEGDVTPPLGSTVSITVNLGTKQGTVLVPLGALYDDGQGTGVWTLNKKESTVSLTRVKVSRISTETASIQGDFDKGELIAAMGAHRLHENELVRVSTNEIVTP